MTADTSPASSLPLDRYSFPAFLIHSAVSPLPSTSPRILGHPQCYVRETRTPYYEKRCSRSEPRHFPDCLAAFTRRLLTAGSYSRVAYYAFVGGRFSSILSFSRFTTPASASPLSLSLFCSFRLRPSVVPTQAKEALASLCTPRRTAEQKPKAMPRESVRE